MLIADHIAPILTVTGCVTALVVLQFFFPKPVLKLLSKIELHDEAAIFFARHWGLLAFSMGALLVYAASHPELRAPVILFAAIEKAGLVACVIMHAGRPYTRGLRLTAVFDGICVLIYAAYLGGIA